MKKVLVSLLVGMTLCGGLFGCGNVVDDTRVEYSYDEYQEILNPYREAADYIQQELDTSGYTYQVHLNEATKTVVVSYSTGDTSVTDLRNAGYSDSEIMQLGDIEGLYTDCQTLAVVCYGETVAKYGVADIKILVSIKIGGETMCEFNQDGDCVYSVF